MVAQIQPLMPRVMDAFQTYLRELRPTDLDGSAGLYRLKEELTRRVNAAVAPNRITAVLFKEIVVISDRCENDAVLIQSEKERL